MKQDTYSEFRELLQQWGRRDPELSAEHASTRVLASLEDSRRPGFRRIVQTGAAALFLCLGLFGLHRIIFPEPDALLPSPSGTNEVVLIWLDEQTPLYMNIGTKPESKGDPS